MKSNYSQHSEEHNHITLSEKYMPFSFENDITFVDSEITLLSSRASVDLQIKSSFKSAFFPAHISTINSQFSDKTVIFTGAQTVAVM